MQSEDQKSKKKPKAKAKATRKAAAAPSKDKKKGKVEREKPEPKGKDVGALVESAGKLLTLLTELTAPALWRSVVRAAEVERRLSKAPAILQELEDAVTQVEDGSEDPGHPPRRVQRG